MTSIFKTNTLWPLLVLLLCLAPSLSQWAFAESQLISAKQTALWKRSRPAFGKGISPSEEVQTSLKLLSSINLANGTIQIIGRIDNKPPGFHFQSLRPVFVDNAHYIDLFGPHFVTHLADDYFLISLPRSSYEYTQAYGDLFWKEDLKPEELEITLSVEIDPKFYSEQTTEAKKKLEPNQASIHLYYPAHLQKMLDTAESRQHLFERDINNFIAETQVLYPQVPIYQIIQPSAFGLPVGPMIEAPVNINPAELPLAEHDDVLVSKLNRQLMRMIEKTQALQSKLNWVRQIYFSPTGAPAFSRMKGTRILIETKAIQLQKLNDWAALRRKLQSITHTTDLFLARFYTPSPPEASTEP